MPAEHRVTVNVADGSAVKAALDAAHARVVAADALAAGVRSFLSSLPYQAPEAISFQASAKLLVPLREFEAVIEGQTDAA